MLLSLLFYFGVPFAAFALLLNRSIPKRPVRVRPSDRFALRSKKEADSLGPFDFIVVGSGSAGSALAGTLAEKLPNKSILLIESGGDHHKDRSIQQPGGWANLLGNWTDTDWGYSYIRTSVARFIHLNRGRLTGGTSAINAQMYNRCSPSDFDHWRDLTGNDEFSWKSMQKIFVEMEDCSLLPKEMREECEKSAGTHHGFSGPIRVSVSPADFMAESVLDSAASIGTPRTLDTNNENDREHLGYTVHNSARSRRFDSFSSFVEPRIATCKNLRIITHSTVHRIGFSDSKKASSVLIEATLHGESGERVMKEVKVNDEVLLTAGAFGSPQILMLSGIGERDQLEKCGVPIVSDLPAVGKNLKEHTSTGIGFWLAKNVDTPSKDDIDEHPMIAITGNIPSSRTLAARKRFAEGDQRVSQREREAEIQVLGLWGSLCDVFINLGLPNDIFAPNSVRDCWKSRATFWFRSFLYSLNFGGFLFRRRIFFGLVVNNRPLSSGTMELLKRSPEADAVRINANLFSQEADIQAHTDGRNWWRRLVRQGDPAKHLFDGEMDPGDKGEEHDRRFTHTKHSVIWHPTSTCRAASKDDRNAVCDPDLRVRGVSGLRVCCAAAFPEITTGNTNAPAMALGVKSAEMIAKEYRQ